MTVKQKASRRRTPQPDEGKLSAEIRQELEEAREQMARGEYVTHEEIMARYG